MRDKKLWIFNSGTSFSGNPKYLFLWITEHRPDIKGVWLCYTGKSRDYIRRLGYEAHLFDSARGKQIGAKAGVYVVDQNKEIFQDYLDGIVVLNLWHGVGCKAIEQGLESGILNEPVAEKNIRNAHQYHTQLFLVTSPLMEKHFVKMCNLQEKQLIRAGYPRCDYHGSVSDSKETPLLNDSLPTGAKIAVYAPTYRNDEQGSFLQAALPDIPQLIEALKDAGYILVLKMHPNIEKDPYYQNLCREYANEPRLIFWDNANDFYEVMGRIDLAIVDYSSIFYDMLARGVKRFARYIFDYEHENAVRPFALDYLEHTCGRICKNYDEFLNLFANPPAIEQNELDRINELFWSYSSPSTFEAIVDAALGFEPDLDEELPTLYSFDVFDTLISRTTLEPKGVFSYVQQKILDNGGYPAYVTANFRKIRPWAESNCREFYRKSQEKRGTDHIEISFDMIYARIAELYGLTADQTEQLKTWELECEYACSIPLQKNIERTLALHDEGNDVVLISDMYLPKAFVQKLLSKANPRLAELPLFLSSEYGVQKTTKKLFFEVYHTLDYHYGTWVHCGDNPKADGSIPAALGIQTEPVEKPQFNRYERELRNFRETYDAYQVAALFTRFREQVKTSGLPEDGADVFAYCYASLYWVPYIAWVVQDAASRGYEHLCFISRDGHYLKIVADAVIRARGLALETRYLYGSRRAWRIPSQIDGIDDDLFGGHGNFVDIKTWDALLEAAALSEAEFCELFPDLANLKEKKTLRKKDTDAAVARMASSAAYRKRLLEVAAERRAIVRDYLNQEVGFDKSTAYVEFWGRGYAQECLARLLWDAAGSRFDVPFYYARSIYPSEKGMPRHNFTGNNWPLTFIEALFANVPYKSIEGYERVEGGRIEPAIVPCENNAKLHEALERQLAAFATDYCSLDLLDPERSARELFDFGLSFFHNNPDHAVVSNNFSTLKDAVATYGSVAEYAPPLQAKTLLSILRGGTFDTDNLAMSLARSKKPYRKAYKIYQRNFRDTWHKLRKRFR